MNSFTLEQQKVALTVEAGVCRFRSKVTSWVEDGLLKCSIESNCKHVQELGRSLESINIEMMDILKMPFSENQVYIIGGRTLKHSTCPLPMAVLKSFEAAAGLGLKRDVSVVFEK